MTRAVPDGSHEPPTARRRSGRVVWISLFAVVVSGIGAALFLNAPAGLPPSSPGLDAPSVAADTTASPHRVVAYYFHTTYRCSSCRKIEAYSHLAMETGFSEEIADGRLVWQVVNVEERENEHFVKDYQLYTKSLVLSDERSGREVRWKNLAKVWELLGDEPAFVDYVQTETRAYLDTAP